MPVPKFWPLLAARIAAIVRIPALAPDARAFDQVSQPAESVCSCPEPLAAASMWSPSASGKKISEQTGQPVLVDIKPGAGGVIAVNELMPRDPDGCYAAGHDKLARHSARAREDALASKQRPYGGRCHLFHHVRHGCEQGEHGAVSKLDRASPKHPRQSGARSAARARQPRASLSALALCSSSRLPASIWSTCRIAATRRCFRRCCKSERPAPVRPASRRPRLHIQDGKLRALAVTGDRMPKLPVSPHREAAKLDYPASTFGFS